MTFLQQFFTDVFKIQSRNRSESVVANTRTAAGKSMKVAAPDRVKSHLQVSTYDDFELTEAIRPSLDLQVQPKQGYRHEVYVDENGGADVPVIMASVTREWLFPVFMELVSHLGEEVDVVLETSHDHAVSGHLDLYREHIDLPVLSSILWEYEDLLTDDGCTGIAVLNPSIPQEIQFDEHKLLIMYGSPLEPFEMILEKFGIHHDPEMSFITEAEHVHSSTAKFQTQFEDMRLRLGTCTEEEEDEYRDEEDDMMGGFA